MERKYIHSETHSNVFERGKNQSGVKVKIQNDAFFSYSALQVFENINSNFMHSNLNGSTVWRSIELKIITLLKTISTFTVTLVIRKTF